MTIEIMERYKRRASKSLESEVHVLYAMGWFLWSDKSEVHVYLLAIVVSVLVSCGQKNDEESSSSNLHSATGRDCTGKAGTGIT